MPTPAEILLHDADPRIVADRAAVAARRAELYRLSEGILSLRDRLALRRRRASRKHQPPTPAEIIVQATEDRDPRIVADRAAIVLRRAELDSLSGGDFRRRAIFAQLESLLASEE